MLICIPVLLTDGELVPSSESTEDACVSYLFPSMLTAPDSNRLREKGFIWDRGLREDRAPHQRRHVEFIVMRT